MQLLGLALEMHFVHLPQQLRPVGTGSEGGDVVSVQAQSWAHIQPYMHYQQYCIISTPASIVEAVLEQYWKLQGTSVGSYSACCVGQYNYAETMLFILCKYWDTARDLLSNCLFILICNSLLYHCWCSVWHTYSGSGIDKDNVTWGFKQLSGQTLELYFTQLISRCDSHYSKELVGKN